MTAPTAVITGASRGLGHALARTYAARGWRVIPVCRRGEDAARLAAEFPCAPVVCDLAGPAADGLGDAVGARAARVELLVHAAGIPGSAALAEALDADELAALLDVHCVAAARCARALLPLLRAARPGRMVNVTSRVGSMARNARGDFDGEGISYAYRVAKAAQNMLTLALSRELPPDQVLVLSVHPGEFRSGLNPDGPEDADDAAARLAAWIDAAGPAHHGRCHDPRTGEIPW
ncbi:MAG TPA: SDR family NAD(P)-dependent oxidoreductase [Longimicrobium sp.]|nr:SDR family NAD(P)-dependent oxidoreductase [Longimicrobium sp.]